jgi:hypothetical protein
MTFLHEHELKGNNKGAYLWVKWKLNTKQYYPNS